MLFDSKVRRLIGTAQGNKRPQIFMKSTKRRVWRRLLKFRCTGCAVCCTEPIVPVTNGDVARIMKANGQTARQIVRFFGPNEVIADQRVPLWIKLRQGRRLMGLRKRRGHCQYLYRGRCQIYPHRPATCRLYPFNVFFDSTGHVETLEINDAVECDYALDGKITLGTVQALYSRDEKQDETYFAKVKRWNARRSNGTAQEFLTFLGLEENSPQENMARTEITDCPSRGRGGIEGEPRLKARG